MERLINEYKANFSDKKFLISVLIGALILILSLVVNFYTGQYADSSASNRVNDIILDNIPTVDVDGIFVYGPFFMFFFLAILCFVKIRRLPYIFKTIALFIFIRSVFTSLTHIGIPPNMLKISSPPRFFNDTTFDAALFFSGHTGLPFLLGLIFQKKKYLKYIFFLAAVFFGAIVLLGHLHYSIDVFSAFFITYAIYRISLRIFANDFSLFEGVERKGGVL